MLATAVIEHDVSDTATARKFDPLEVYIRIETDKRAKRQRVASAERVVPFALLAKLKNRKR